jgi:DNA replication protein DnaC
MTASDGISYRMSEPTVCILDMFLAPGLIAKLDDIPKNISSPKIESKPMTPSSAIFTGRRDYLAKLRAYFSTEPNEPLRRKSFLLYGMGGIGKTQICLKFTEENSDL